MFRNPLETMKAEDAYCVELLRKAFPGVPDEKLGFYSIRMRTERYATGRWNTTAELQQIYDPYINGGMNLPFYPAGAEIASALRVTRNPVSDGSNCDR